MTFSRTLQLALGATAIVCLVVVYSSGAPLVPVLLGALVAFLWIAGKAWRQRSASFAQEQMRDQSRSDSEE